MMYGTPILSFEDGWAISRIIDSGELVEAFHGIGVGGHSARSRARRLDQYLSGIQSRYDFEVRWFQVVDRFSQTRAVFSCIDREEEGLRLDEVFPKGKTLPERIDAHARARIVTFFEEVHGSFDVFLDLAGILPIAESMGVPLCVALPKTTLERMSEIRQEIEDLQVQWLSEPEVRTREDAWRRSFQKKLNKLTYRYAKQPDRAGDQHLPAKFPGHSTEWRQRLWDYQIRRTATFQRAPRHLITARLNISRGLVDRRDDTLDLTYEPSARDSRILEPVWTLKRKDGPDVTGHDPYTVLIRAEAIVPWEEEGEWLQSQLDQSGPATLLVPIEVYLLLGESNPVFWPNKEFSEWRPHGGD